MENPDGDTKIWRYMDFTKFVSLISTNNLIFPRADMFDDPYEGAFPLRTIEAVRVNNSVNIANQLIAGTEEFQKSVFVSCWHMSNFESAAMWDLYLSGTEGVAIQTDVDTLRKFFETSELQISTSKIKYLDYDSQVIPPTNMMYPYVHKRNSFEHEKEFRALISEHDTNDAIKQVKVNARDLIKRVYVCPKAPNWFYEVVVDVVKQYGVDVPIEKSAMYTRPTY
ncbi:hypothetical protein CAG58_14285 [Vibrio sp. V31_P5A7T61]|uniref:DUF2971 domain-containing protein n=1 Tax=unclassified Vibrio TaxID=2614977 RepID=UPI001372DDC5|nr:MULTISPECIES: DUF2971 domain-containing protein [unclassified Vibrio]NAW63109.1 hypothetical protein [Vibrio sp. V31_P5A7T61]NAX02657.1 hypothetical protein [Vibrio sp. V34_P3A8T189]NAX64620.1 hypothetical protein [Vibrio sp. V32_P6A28T40]